MNRIKPDFILSPKFSADSIISLKIFTENGKNKRKSYGCYWGLKIRKNSMICNLFNHDLKEVRSVLFYSSTYCFPELKMCVSSRMGYKNLVEYFVSIGANKFNWGLENASRGGHNEIVEFLISKGANKFNKALCNASYGGYKILLNILFTKVQIILIRHYNGHLVVDTRKSSSF